MKTEGRENTNARPMVENAYGYFFLYFSNQPRRKRIC